MALLRLKAQQLWKDVEYGGRECIKQYTYELLHAYDATPKTFTMMSGTDTVLKHTTAWTPVQHASMLPMQVGTSDLQGAGTDADISVNIIGDQGETGYIALRSLAKGQQLFQQGAVDVFTIERALFVGTVRRLGLKSDGAGSRAAWNPNNIDVVPGTPEVLPPEAPKTVTEIAPPPPDVRMATSVDLVRPGAYWAHQCALGVLA